MSLVPQDQIPAFINFAEWNLGKHSSGVYKSATIDVDFTHADGVCFLGLCTASSVSTDSVIHFLAYIPSSERGQLLLQKG